MRVVKPAIKFFEDIKGNCLIIHDYDTDGCCSAAIIARILRNKKIKYKLFSSYHQFSINKRFLKNFDNLIFCDIPEIDKKLIENLKNKKILIIDHHKPIKYKNAIYCNPRVFKKDIYIPTTFLTYKIAESLKIEIPTWIAACGILADKGVKNCKEVFNKLRKERMLKKAIYDENYLFDKTKIGKITKFISSLTFYYWKNSSIVSKELAIEDSYKSFLKNKKFIKAFNFIENEKRRIFEEFKKKRIKINDFIFFEFKSKINLKSLIATLLARRYKDKVLLVGQKFGKYLDVSLREGEKCEYDLRKLIEKMKKFIPKLVGGGHERAAAFKMNYKQKDELLNFLKIANSFTGTLLLRK